MQRVQILLQKLTELSKQDEKNTAIDIDLMLDYTKVLYADLLEYRKKLDFPIQSLANEPTLSEVAQKMERENDEEPKEMITTVNKQLQVEQDHSFQETVKAELPVDKAPLPSTKHIKKNVRQTIGINDKYLLISELFSNNKAAYEEVLDEVNKLESYQQALNWLDTNIHNQYGWNEDSEAVQLFYGILGNFFDNK
ncbi:MAG TPA: hypothetical protein VN721_03055 [Flavipsychrobacter sp.]|nr:hypothetical protein [Flavipsychrobacter sp.]